MTTASSSTKLKASDKLDSRPAIFGRKVTSTFRKMFSFDHRPPGNIRTCWIPPLVALTPLLNVPKLLKLRFYLKKERQKRDPDDVRILFYSDNLDETNGIANNLRNVIPYMRRLFSMEQLGYANSELAIPRISPALRLLKRYPIDMIELETPSPGAWVVCLCAWIAGIKVFSHYRTDVPTYAKTLVKAKWMHTYVLWLMRIFYWMARPVISPCDDYANILQKDLKVPANQVQILPRGLPLDRFSPTLRGKGAWEKFGSERANKPVRFAFIGRISKEKNLEFLNSVWSKFSAKHDDVELMYVGYGWYLEEIKKQFKDNPSVCFAGEQGGEMLASLYADADFFLFPSTTDTFGNVVVEAMSTGTPAIVSNYGGPHDIVQDDSCGRILPIDEAKWLETLEECRTIKLEKPELYEQMRIDSHKRSERYTLASSTKTQFEHACKLDQDAVRVFQETQAGNVRDLSNPKEMPVPEQSPG